jgi:ubiquinone/menaquinone biosynthesis C-methylase UbiE
MASTTRRGDASAYDRVAAFYDWYAAPMDVLGGRRARARLFGRARGRVLELGVGTGLNLASYPPGVRLTAIDLSPRMLARARRRAAHLGLDVDLRVADIQALPFPDASFDTVAATRVFCSVADPLRGLREAARVVRDDGQVLLYEHVRPRTPLLGALADLVSPLARRLLGPELNRRTEHTVELAGLRISDVRRRGIWREIVAVSAPGTH